MVPVPMTGAPTPAPAWTDSLGRAVNLVRYCMQYKKLHAQTIIWILILFYHFFPWSLVVLDEFTGDNNIVNLVRYCKQYENLHAQEKYFMYWFFFTNLFYLYLFYLFCVQYKIKWQLYCIIVLACACLIIMLNVVATLNRNWFHVSCGCRPMCRK